MCARHTPCVHTMCTSCVHVYIMCTSCTPCAHHVYTMCTHVYTMCTPCVHHVYTCVHVYTMCTSCVRQMLAWLLPGINQCPPGAHSMSERCTRGPRDYCILECPLMKERPHPLFLSSAGSVQWDGILFWSLIYPELPRKIIMLLQACTKSYHMENTYDRKLVNWMVSIATKLWPTYDIDIR